MRWSDQGIAVDDGALPGLQRIGFVRSVRTPQFDGITFHEVLCKSALNKVPNAAMLPFRFTVNGYRGCAHACRYCFARPTHEYLELDPGGDFDTQIVVKTNIVDVLRRELARPSWRRETVALGTNTDPYQRAEGRYELMPGIIGALAAAATPMSILTKGTLLRRDLPLIADAAQQVPLSVSISLAVGDPELHRDVEPGTPSPQARLGLIAAVRDAGLECHVMVGAGLAVPDGLSRASRRAARSNRGGRRQRRHRVRPAPAQLDPRLVHGVAGAFPPRTRRHLPPAVPARAPTCRPTTGRRCGGGRRPWWPSTASAATGGPSHPPLCRHPYAASEPQPTLF